jgi:hypothetical protein
MLLHTRSLVGSIIDTRESSFRKRQVKTGQYPQFEYGGLDPALPLLP